ncbi:MAG: sugar transferase [Acidimicrobiales bacterium]
MRSSAGTTYQFGLATAVVGVATLHARFVDSGGYDLLRSSRLPWWLLVAVVLMAAGYGLGLPELPARRRDAVVRGLTAASLASGVVAMAQLALAQPVLPRSSLGLLVVIAPIWSVVGWDLARDMTSWRTQRDQVFVVAEQADDHASLRFELQDRPEWPAAVVGWLDLERARLGGDGRARLIEAVERTGATVVVLDTAAQSDDGVVQQAAVLHGRGVRIRTLALFYEGWLGKLPVAELARVSLLFDIGELHRLRYVRSKRVIDLVVGLVGTVVLALAVPVVVAGNRWGNPGPLLYAQPRVGKDGSVFTIYKFRTMATAASGEAAGAGTAGSAWTTESDPRITRFGRVLRRSHLDELPQMVNILRGELSIVGPRPEQPHYVDELREKVPFYDIRHLVRPGLTGWAQVKQGYTADEADALEKLQYDVYYLRRQGLALDVRILWRTVRDVLGGRGR